MPKHEYSPLPPEAAELLQRLGAPSRLVAHLTLVHDVARQLLSQLRTAFPKFRPDEAAILFGAATHDIGFERDKRHNLVTHKIDPVIDDEREYVNQTLSWTGLVAARGHVMPPDPLTEAKTATGGEFHSDGRILVLVLQSQPTEAQ